MTADELVLKTNKMVRVALAGIEVELVDWSSSRLGSPDEMLENVKALTAVHGMAQEVVDNELVLSCSITLATEILLRARIPPIEACNTAYERVVAVSLPGPVEL